jgi:hypothetical protein
MPARQESIDQDATENLMRVLKKWPGSVYSSELWSVGSCGPHKGEMAPSIPIVLVHATAPKQPNRSNSALSRAQLLDGWDIWLPAAWSMPFWKSLVYAGARVGGM